MSEEEERSWFHVILTAYGAWLYGDRRGFRTRHHREHVEGDYKSPPPPDQYAMKEQRSRASLKQEAVVIPEDLRAVVGAALKERLEELGALVIALSVSGQHVHTLAKMPVSSPRTWAGTAKRHAWFVLRDHGWTGKLWGKRSQAVPVPTRTHQLNVYRYIAEHKEEGAWVWLWAKKE